MREMAEKQSSRPGRRGPEGGPGGDQDYRTGAMTAEGQVAGSRPGSV